MTYDPALGPPPGLVSGPPPKPEKPNPYNLAKLREAVAPDGVISKQIELLSDHIEKEEAKREEFNRLIRELEDWAVAVDEWEREHGGG